MFSIFTICSIDQKVSNNFQIKRQKQLTNDKVILLEQSLTSNIVQMSGKHHIKDDPGCKNVGHHAPNYFLKKNHFKSCHSVVHWPIVVNKLRWLVDLYCKSGCKRFVVIIQGGLCLVVPNPCTGDHKFSLGVYQVCQIGTA